MVGVLSGGPSEEHNLRCTKLQTEPGRLLPDQDGNAEDGQGDRKSTRLNSSHSQISYAVFCLKKKNSQHRSSDVGYDACPLANDKNMTLRDCMHAVPRTSAPITRVALCTLIPSAHYLGSGCSV